MKLEVGKTYPCADGVSVKIVYKLDCTPDKSESLYVGVKVKKDWESLITDTLFREDGTQTYMNADYILVDPTTLPDIPWSQIPPWLNYWAVDLSGRQYYYGERPQYDGDTWMVTAPEAQQSSMWKVPDEHHLPYTGCPEDSLRKRPETPGTKG